MAKAKIVEKKKFIPITIEVTLETQRELDLFAGIFDYTPLCEMDGVEDDWCEPIRNAIYDTGAAVGSLEIINEFNEEFK